MLRQEREEQKEELSGLSLNLDIDEMKERSETLRSAREERRQRVADEKLVEHVRVNNPDIRQVRTTGQKIFSFISLFINVCLIK